MECTLRKKSKGKEDKNCREYLGWSAGFHRAFLDVGLYQENRHAGSLRTGRFNVCARRHANIKGGSSTMRL